MGKEIVEQMFWVENRGVILSLPPQSTERIACATSETPISTLERQRLNIIRENPILRQRYRNSADGVKYMGRVDLGWRSTLYDLAEEVSEKIKCEAGDMGKTEIAIVLFGSVARTLSRRPDDPDPSNIDIAVIDSFTLEEKNELFDRIRPYRIEGQVIIGNNVGVHIHRTDQLTNGDYCLALQYIGSSARALYDPASLWRDIENEAIVYSYLKKSHEEILEQVRRSRRFWGTPVTRNAHFTERLWREKIEALKREALEDQSIRKALVTPKVQELVISLRVENRTTVPGSRLVGEFTNSYQASTLAVQ